MQAFHEAKQCNGAGECRLRGLWNEVIDTCAAAALDWLLCATAATGTAATLQLELRLDCDEALMGLYHGGCEQKRRKLQLTCYALSSMS